jgi:hypothetical protein
MKPLIMSGLLLLFWIGGYYIWDYQQFRKVTPAYIPTPRLNPSPGNPTLWTDFFDSYSFTVTPTDTCSESCCLQLHLLQWELEEPKEVAGQNICDLDNG